jgi:hypothetical protein
VIQSAAESEIGPRATFTDAKLAGVVINWYSIALISAILVQRATNDSERELAVYGPTHKVCWEKLYALHHPAENWAIGVLAPYVRDGDNAPRFLRDAAKGVILAAAGPHV